MRACVGGRDPPLDVGLVACVPVHCRGERQDAAGEPRVARQGRSCRTAVPASSCWIVRGAGSFDRSPTQLTNGAER